MKKIIFLFKICIFIFFTFINIYFVTYYHKYNEYYKERLIFKTSKEVEIGDIIRGEIYDKNGILLVGNKKVNNYAFRYNDNIDLKEVINKINKVFPDISKEDVEKIINTGYIYDYKIIKKDISDEMVNLLINENIPGTFITFSYERYYPYKDNFRNIFGKVGKITKENKNEYLKKGYMLNDMVGLSGLEYEYDSFLKGKKAIYKVKSDNSLILVKEAEKGNDLHLSIDINLALKINEIIKEELLIAKKKMNTEYLTDSYVIISNPKTGEIISMNGQRYQNKEFLDVSLNNINTSYTMGSVVKGATISVGYKYNLIDPNKKIFDSCVKLKNMTEKCSHKKLGYLNDIKALEQSSNYYQFLIAISLCGYNYQKDMVLNASEKEFNIYRTMLSSYGLGTLTGIDIPNEKTGILGKKISDDLLLNLSIGQYDTYTPIELITYINTLSDYGNKRKPSLVKSISDVNGSIILNNKYDVIENVDIEKEDMARIHQGFYDVMNKGTGRGFMNYDLIPAGKTGTSESFLDTNNDKVIDTKTITLTMAGFFPYENPQYSMIVISPNVSHNNGSKEYIYYLTSKISRKITNYMNDNLVNFMFEK